MGKKRKGKASSDSIPKHTPNGENEKRLNQVPNSKNPKVPGTSTLLNATSGSWIWDVR